MDGFCVITLFCIIGILYQVVVFVPLSGRPSGIIHGGFFRKCGHLGLFEAKPTCVIHGLARYSFFCFRSKRVDRCVGVEHEEYLEAVDLTPYVGTIPTWLASYFLV